MKILQNICHVLELKIDKYDQLHLCSYTQTYHDRYVDFLHGKIVD